MRERVFNEQAINDIARHCGSRAVKNSVSFLCRMYHVAPKNLICETYDGVAFYGAAVCKHHLRLYEIAVKEECQGKGYGKAMMLRMVGWCRRYGLDKITFRTAKDETAVEFYKKLGAAIVGEKGDDYEMELKV